MSQTKYQLLAPENERQYKEARRLTVDWVMEHAGAHRSQARKALQNRHPRRLWQRDGLSIELSRIPNGYQEGMRLTCELYSIGLASRQDLEKGYQAYAAITEMTLDQQEYSAAPETYRAICVTCRYSSDPDNAGYPWPLESVSLDQLRERYVQLAATHTQTPEPDDTSTPNQELAGMFRAGASIFRETAIVLTPSGAADPELAALAQQHTTWCHIIRPDHRQLVESAQAMDPEDIAAWVTKKLSILERDPVSPPTKPRLALATDSIAEASRYLNDKQRQRASEALDETHLITLRLLETAFISLEASFGQQQSVGSESKEQLRHMQQTIDQLKSERDELRRERNELRRQCDSYRAALNKGTPRIAETEPAKSGGETPYQRQMAVSDAVTRPGEYENLTFLENALEPLGDYAGPRPRSEEIIAALSTLNALAQAYRNTPNRKVGSWNNYFLNLPGWKYAPQESDSTMSQFGDRRRFRNGNAGSRVPMTRHLTYTGSHSGLQIYFAPGENGGPWAVGYIGEHLPYAGEK